MTKNNIDFDSYFEEIFEEYFSGIYYYVLNINYNSDDASDISQETFIKFYNKKEFFSDQGKLRGWLFKVARNLTMDKFRKIKKILFSEYHIKNIPVKIEEDQNIKYKKLWDELKKLKEKHREILFLKYYENLSYKEIADILKINEGTVMSRLSRAKISLKEKMSYE